MTNDFDSEFSRFRKKINTFGTIKYGPMPSDVRECCELFGLMFEHLSVHAIERACNAKAPMVDGLIDQKYVEAKQKLFQWLAEQPDDSGDAPDQPFRVPRRPIPPSGSAAIELPLPKDESWES